MAKSSLKSTGSFQKGMYRLFRYVHNHITTLNNSKLFAGLIIITLNISSKFVNLKLSKSIEAYLKYTFSRQILIFSIAWMGTRDIYIALAISLLFWIIFDFLLNEDSMFCCLHEDFTTHHINLLQNDPNAPASAPTQTSGYVGAGADSTANPAQQGMTNMSEPKMVTLHDVQQAKSILEKAKIQGLLQEPVPYTPYSA